MDRVASFWKILGLLLLLSGGGIALARGMEGPHWHLRDVTHHLPDLWFSLIDDQRYHVTANDYHGDIVLLYFGFTRCSAECPLAMQRTAEIIRSLKDKSHVRVLFVTVDPGHDSPADLRGFLSHFDSAHMTGLTGSAEALTALAKRYRTAARPGAGIVHSDTIYVFDGQGHARLLLTPQDAPADAAADIAQLESASAWNS